MRLLAALLALSFAGTALADKVDDVIRAQMAANHIPGVTLLVKKGDRVLKRTAYGLADIELNVPMKPEMLLETGSIGKTFTAVDVMRLVEAGKLSLEDSVTKYVPEGAPKWDGITVRMLLTHTSGIPDYALVDGLRLTELWEVKDFLKKMPTLPFDATPGTSWQYSNSNYVLLGLIVEKLTGKSVLDYTVETVFKPLGMTRSMVLDYSALIPNRAAGYYLASTGLINAPQTHGGTGDGAMLTTVDDLATFERAFRDGKLVSPEHVKLMRTRFALPNGHMPFYGCGWFVRNTNHLVQYSHAGASAGYGATISYFPAKDMTVAIMGNVYGGIGDDTARLVAEALEPSLKAPRLKAATDPDPTRTNGLLSLAQEIASGKPPKNGLDPDYASRLATPRGRMGIAGMKPFTSMKSLAFLESEQDGTDLILRYRAHLDSKPWLVSFVLNKDGQLYSAGTRAEG
ncbi:MAG TPA: serine hydrolase domain-containing protein [Fimbriimonadaceae bacterium]|nr:serine hydrolase domain-containing protein [Fimbriimonadaceae bacterium]